MVMPKIELREEKMRPLRIILAQDISEALNSSGITHQESLACTMWLVKQMIDLPIVNDLLRLQYIGLMAAILENPRAAVTAGLPKA